MKYKSRNQRRINFPKMLEIEGRTYAIHNGRIPIQEILRSSDNYSILVNLYRQKVLSQPARTIRLLGRKNPASILNTLLGYEVQSAYKRIQCPDLATARFIRLFSELGCHSIQLPYDPTHTAELIPEFEVAVDRIKMQIRALFPTDASLRIYYVRRAFEIIRRQLSAA
jgi:hypothetical protein